MSELPSEIEDFLNKKFKNRYRKTSPNDKKALFFILLVVLVGCLYQAYSDHLLEKEHAFIIGKFDKFESYSAKNSQGYRLYATFKLNGQTYTSVSNLGTRLSSKLEELFLKKLINNDVEIVYRLNQPSNSQVLLTQKAFNMYGRIMPDSLKWIDSLINLSTQ